MVEKWGADIERVLDSAKAVECLRQCTGIGPKTAERIKAGWDMNRGELMAGWDVNMGEWGVRGSVWVGRGPMPRWVSAWVGRDGPIPQPPIRRHTFPLLPIR